MGRLILRESDIQLHVASFGCDVYEPIEIANERTRLHMFYEEARHRLGHLFGGLTTNDAEFRITRDFEGSSGTVSQDMFVLTPRGPVMIFPLRLPEPIGDTGLQEKYKEDFHAVRELFFSIIPDRKIMRLGLVRSLIFSTGKTLHSEIISGQAEFAGAQLVGGKRLAAYKDDQFNVRISTGTVELSTQMKLAVGTTIQREKGYGIQVQFDVNNVDVGPMDEADIQGVIQKAASLWPEHLLKYLCKESSA